MTPRDPEPTPTATNAAKAAAIPSAPATAPASDAEAARIAAARAESDHFRDAVGPKPPPVDAIPNYTLVCEIGRGGMGVVYEARQLQPPRAVALKMMRGGALADRRNVRLFEREIETLARLRHPAIASILEAGRTRKGRYFFTMELVRGVPITEYVRIHNLSLPETLRLFQNLCHAVHYAHQRGVIHRDLKPTNVPVDNDGQVKILDFGLARIAGVDPALGSVMLEAGKIMGTLPYMSPEQARVRPGETADEVDTRTDVYSLGVILYELLTDELPHDVTRALPHEALRMICEDTPRAPRVFRHDLHPELETIILKALERDPARRYDTPAAFADDLERHLQRQPILARRPSAAYIFHKWLSRNRTGVVVGFILSAVVVAFGITYVVQARAIADAQRAIEAAQEPAFRSQEWALTVRLRESAQELERISRDFMAAGNFADAIPVLQEVANILRHLHNDEHPTVVQADLLIADCLVAERRYADAAELLTECWNLVPATKRAARPDMHALAAELVQIYESWQHPQEAAAWRAQLATLEAITPRP